MELSNRTVEIRISDSSDWKLFDQIAKNLEQDFFAKSIAVCDGVDQAYYDFAIGGSILTLHLEHYLGISLFLKNPSEATEDEMTNLARLSDYFNSAISWNAQAAPSSS